MGRPDVDALMHELTPEELNGWAAYFQAKHELERTDEKPKMRDPMDMMSHFRSLAMR